MFVTSTPADDRDRRGDDLPGELDRAGAARSGRRARRRAAISAAPREDPACVCRSSPSSQEQRAATSTPAKIASPPSSGVAPGREAALARLVDGADAHREAARRAASAARPAANATTKAKIASRSVHARRGASQCAATRPRRGRARTVRRRRGADSVGVERVALGDRRARARPARRARLEVGRQRGGDDLADLGEVLDLQAAGRERAACRCAGRWMTIGGRGSNGTALRLTVMPIVVQAVLGLLAVELGLAQVDEHEVHVGAAGQDVDAVAGAQQLLGDAPARRRSCAAGARGRPRSARSCSATALPAITCSSGPPCWPGNTAELIFFACSSLAEDHAAARAAERLVDRRGDDVGVRHRARVQARRRRARRSAPCRPSAARRPRRRSRGSARSRAGAGRPTSRRAISFGLRSRAMRATSSMSIRLRLAVDLVGAMS